MVLFLSGNYKNMYAITYSYVLNISSVFLLDFSYRRQFCVLFKDPDKC